MIFANLPTRTLCSWWQSQERFYLHINNSFADIKTDQGEEEAQPKTNQQKDNAEKDFKTIWRYEKQVQW